MIDRLLSHVAPHSCCGCGEVGAELCEGCKHNIISDGFSVCIGCLRPTHGDNLCDICTDFPADGFWCAGWRQAELKALLDLYKFRAVRSASLPLVDMLDTAIPVLPRETVVTIVPTTTAHTRQRGFDHIALIGSGFAKQRGLRFQSLLCRTTGGTQHFMTKKERFLAAGAAFTLAETELPQSVLLIDDILTTGATFRATLSLLRGAGVTSLQGAVIARQPLDGSPDL